MQKKDDTSENANLLYPPVVSVLGHVDHGKTTLLDTIRKTAIASREKGGITQKIGASQIELVHDGINRKITFIDTPGHEAFANMRAKGVSASDIGVLVVAADDGVMPQTQESIKKLLETKIPIIVAITKADLPVANVEKVKQQLLREGIMLEGINGDVPYIVVSAKTGERVHDLLDLILLVYDLSQTKKSTGEDFYGIVIESKLDRKRGVVATVVVKAGVFKQGEKVFMDKEVGKARALINTEGKTVKDAVPGDAVEIIGLKDVVPTGSIIYSKPVKIEAVIPDGSQVQDKKLYNLYDFLSKKEVNKLKIVLRTESEAELEAVKNSLPDRVEVLSEGQGDIGVADVLLAKDLGAILVGFNNNITKDAKTLAENENIFFRIYGIIYELLDEVKEAVDDLIFKEQEVVLGKGNILAAFSTPDGGNVLGVKVIEGRIAMNDKIKILREKKEMGKSYIVSLRRGRQEVKEIAKTNECGIQISPHIDFRVGDMILSYK